MEVKWSEKVQRRLDELGWSKSDLSRRSGVPVTTLSRALAEDGNPTLETIQPVDKALWPQKGGGMPGLGEGGMWISDKVLDLIPNARTYLTIINEAMAIDDIETAIPALNKLVQAVERFKQGFSPEGLENGTGFN
jgi:transcriptional regulator with XRE-family HTH domain